MLADLLRSHDGVITLAQANQAGLGRDDVHYRVRTGQWLRCGRGVYFADDREYTDRARIRAGVWAYGEDAVASGLTAAWWQFRAQTRKASPQHRPTPDSCCSPLNSQPVSIGSRFEFRPRLLHQRRIRAMSPLKSRSK